MYQIVTIRLLDFYLVEDVDSRDAENEGLSLILRFKWLPQGIFWLVDGVKTPPTKLRIYFGLSLLLRKRVRDASIYASKKISLKFLFLSDIFLFPPIRQQVPILA